MKLQFPAVAEIRRIRSVIVRYGIAGVSVAMAVGAVSLLRRFGVRDPFVSVFLTAVVVSLSRSGSGAGILAIVLSVVALLAFLHSPGDWFHIPARNLPVFGAFLILGFVVWRSYRSRRRSEQKFEEEKRQLLAEDEMILDAIPCGVALFGPNRVVRRCNPAYAGMVGWAQEEMIGRQAPLPESERETWERQEQQLREGRPIVKYETTRIRKDGSLFSATISATPRFDKDGNYTGFVGVILDDTQRYEQEAERQMLSAMAQHSREFHGVADLEGRARFINKSGQELFGVEGDEHVLRTNVLDYFAEEERERAREELIPRLVRERQLEFETLGKNMATGKTFPIHCNCFVIPDPKTGAPLWIAAVARDITERRRAEEAERRKREQAVEENISLKEENLLLRRLRPQTAAFAEIIGSSPALEGTLDSVGKVAPTDTTVLITGETGTGKELLAHAIHLASRRANKPLITVPCLALVPSLIASEFFGQERGAFTGAERRLGRFEMAQGGTLFLDEVGDLPEESQGSLLRVLEEREFQRIGSNRSMRADVRVVAATNRDLRAAVENGTFRRDLFYRLSGYVIEAPPLRERREDIPMLISHFVDQYAQELGKAVPKIDSASMGRLQARDWPGNIRELRNFVARAMIESEGDALVFDEEMVSKSLLGTARPGAAKVNMSLIESRDYLDRTRIWEALSRSAGRIEGRYGAAELLGINPSTLRSRIKRLKIDSDAFRK